MVPIVPTESYKRVARYVNKNYGVVRIASKFFPFQIKLAIFKTDNGCGWGVKTLENIRKGTFVVEYVGEVITSEEAEERGKSYGKQRNCLIRKNFSV